MTFAVVVFLLIMAAGIIGHRLGYERGYDDGYENGYAKAKSLSRRLM